MSDWRGYVARLLLQWANRIDPDCRIVCDASEHWYFRRSWVQPMHGGAASQFLPSPTAGPDDGQSGG